MFTRKKSSKTGKNVPQEWLESLARLLNETYKTECKQNGRYFDVYGQIYPEEFLLIVSYLSEKDEYTQPISCFLSADQEHISSEKKVKETQQTFIELIGLFFDEIFATEDWDEFEPEWQEVTHKNEKFFFKLSRENINLTLEASKLLGDGFELDDLDNEDQEDEETSH